MCRHYVDDARLVLLQRALRAQPFVQPFWMWSLGVVAVVCAHVILEHTGHHLWSALVRLVVRVPENQFWLRRSWLTVRLLKNRKMG